MGRLGIIDIGSNTVRLVVYTIEKQLPIPMFNEKATCRLGAGLFETGKLNCKGVVKAVSTIERYVLLARAMEVTNLALVATEAVRIASDGDNFIDTINNRCNVKVEVLSGEDEARLAALGIIQGIPEADGLMCDLGGGSLDLVLINSGQSNNFGTLPLGHIILGEVSGNSIYKAREIVEKSFDELPWIQDAENRTLFAAGGSIRTLAKLYIDQSGYPIHIVDEFTIKAEILLDLAKIVSQMSPQSLKNSPSISAKRLNTFPMAALVVECLIRRSRIKEVVFCSSGMREGKLISMMPLRKKNPDPLISACEVLSAASSRFSLPGQELFNWISPLFECENDRHARCRLAACLLSDISWNEHPDYRAKHAFNRTLSLPVVGINHSQRVFLALALYVRYGGDLGDTIAISVLSLIEKDALHGAIVTGMALRLGHVLAGSAPGLLTMASVKRTKNAVILISDQDSCLVHGEVVLRRLKSLAKSLDLSYKIQN